MAPGVWSRVIDEVRPNLQFTRAADARVKDVEGYSAGL
jgi:hypothetical protein